MYSDWLDRDARTEPPGTTEFDNAPTISLVYDTIVLDDGSGWYKIELLIDDAIVRGDGVKSQWISVAGGALICDTVLEFKGND